MIDTEEHRREFAQATYDWDSRNFDAVTPAGFARAAGWKYVPDEKERKQAVEAIKARFTPRTIEEIESLFSAELDRRLSVFLLPDPSGTPKDEYRKAVYPHVRLIREEIPDHLAEPWRKWKDAVKVCRSRRNQGDLPTEEEEETARQTGKAAIESALDMFAALSRELHPARLAVNRTLLKFDLFAGTMDQAAKVEYSDNPIVTDFLLPLTRKWKDSLQPYSRVDQPTAQTIKLLAELLRNFLDALESFVSIKLGTRSDDPSQPFPVICSFFKATVLDCLANAPEAQDALQCVRFDSPEIGEVDYTGVAEGQDEPVEPPKSGRALSHAEKLHRLNRQMEKVAIAKFKGPGAFNLDEIDPRRFVEKMGMKFPTDADAFRTHCKRLELHPDDPRKIEDVECLFVRAIRDTLAPLWGGDAPLVKHIFPYVRARLECLSGRKWKEWKYTVAACREIVKAGGKLTAEDMKKAEDAGTSARWHLSNVLHALFEDMTPCRLPIEDAIVALSDIFGIQIPPAGVPEGSFLAKECADSLRRFSQEHPKEAKAVAKAVDTFQTILRVISDHVGDCLDEQFRPDWETITALKPDGEAWERWVGVVHPDDGDDKPSPITKAWEALLILAEELEAAKTEDGKKFAAEVMEAATAFSNAPETQLELVFDCHLQDPDFGNIDWTGTGPDDRQNGPPPGGTLPEDPFAQADPAVKMELDRTIRKFRNRIKDAGLPFATDVQRYGQKEVPAILQQLRGIVSTRGVEALDAAESALDQCLACLKHKIEFGDFPNADAGRGYFFDLLGDGLSAVMRGKRFRAVVVAPPVASVPTPASPTPPTPPTPPAQPSPPTPPQGHLTVELSPEDRQRLDRIAINTAGTKTSVQNATRALKEGNAIAAESLEAERLTAENTAKIAESLSIRQAESEGMWTREAHPNMRPCVKMCKIGEWILFNGDKEVKYLHSDYQWEILTQLLEAPGEGWVRLDSGWRQKFKGGQSKQDIKDISARIVSESGGPGSGGSSRFRLE